MSRPELPVRRWKRVEYERLVDKGVFEPGERVELIDGLLVVAEPQSSPHYTAIRLVERALARAFGEGWDVRTQAPIALDDDSEPEPDVAVVRGELRDYVEAHPADPGLVVEVARTSRASMPVPAVRSIGSSTWSTACSRCTGSPQHHLRPRTGGTTARWRRWAPSTACLRSPLPPRGSPSPISCRDTRQRTGRARIMRPRG